MLIGGQSVADYGDDLWWAGKKKIYCLRRSRDYAAIDPARPRDDDNKNFPRAEEQGLVPEIQIFQFFCARGDFIYRCL